MTDTIAARHAEAARDRRRRDGSVGATIAPSANAAAQGRSSMSTCATTATVHIVVEHEPDASIEIARRSR